MSDATYAELTAVVYKLTGVTVDESKRSMLTSRVRRRLRALDLEGVDEYVKMLKQLDPDSDEITEFVDVVTTHKTSFFRTPSVWDFLENEFRDERYNGRSITAWSCASSTGEEPYSLAMLLRSVRGDYAKAGKWRIDASDVSELTVKKAQAGEYPAEVVTAIQAARPSVQASSEFEIHGDQVRICPALSEGVHFGVHNLLSARTGSFDVAFLRNVIIYFRKEDSLQVVNNVVNVIKPGGLLVIGEAESLLARGSDLSFEAPCIYRKSE